ncbi:MAG: N-acetylmuramoyl-L-alanine amidase [Epsilonproteobacteria bacterium]|nr:N-acetylmuramoyl-L-alanine amidase [Campylobacterota bacterium]
MRFLFLFLFSILFACNTSSLNEAYKDYYKAQQSYIEALLDGEKQKEINSLKEIIKCGKFLDIDVSKYEAKLKATQQKPKKSASKPKEKKHIFKPTHSHSKYIKILTFNPLKIRLPKNSQIKSFTLKHKLIKRVIDIKNAITPKKITKKFNNVTLKIAQFNKHTVRIVYYSKKPFKLNIKKTKNTLYVYLNGKKRAKPTVIKTSKKRIFSKKIIVIDPGHGGKDSGGYANRVKEKDVVLKVARYLREELKKRGYRVYLTRYRDKFIRLKNRTHFANVKKADLFISLHCNIAPKHLKGPHGIETYFLSPNRSERAIRVARLENREIKGLNYLDQRVILGFLNRDRIIDSNKLAIDIQKGMLSSLRRRYYVKDGGVRPAPFWVLVGTQMPAILIEMGYLTNPTEAKRLKSPAYQKLIAKGIAKGIDEYFKKNP